MWEAQIYRATEQTHLAVLNQFYVRTEPYSWLRKTSGPSSLGESNSVTDGVLRYRSWCPRSPREATPKAAEPRRLHSGPRSWALPGQGAPEGLREVWLCDGQAAGFSQRKGGRAHTLPGSIHWRLKRSSGPTRGPAHQLPTFCLPRFPQR